MNSVFTKITRKAKSGIRKVFDAITFPLYLKSYLKRTTKNPNLEAHGRYAIINLDRQLKADDYGRYFNNICMYMDRAGFKPVIKTTLRDFKGQNSFRFQKLIWKEDYFFVRSCAGSVNSIVLKQPDTDDHVIYLSYGYNVLTSRAFDCIAPYPMHPAQIGYYSDLSVQAQLKTSRRTTRILFAGKAIKELYAGKRVKTFFDVISRLEVIQFIRHHFADRTRSLSAGEDADMLRQLLDSNDGKNEIIISEVKTELKDWLKILSKSDFFIFPPGARMPWCHNSIEAMSVGTIPILEYGNLFHPALENMKNCITYANYEELKSAINTALTLDPAQIEVLRKNVLDYYNKYLSIDSITGKINSFCNSTKVEMKVAIPFIPTWQEAVSIPFRAG